MLPNRKRRGLSRHDVRSRLREMAIQKGPSAKLPTQSELCVQIGTTPATLDVALRDLEEANIIYRRQGSGIYVSPKIHRKTIMVLFDSTFFAANGSPFWGMLWSLFAKEAAYRASFKDEDFQFRLETPPVLAGPPLSEPVMKEIEAGKVDGLICIGMFHSVFEWLESRKVPSVTYAAGLGRWKVETAMEEATGMAVNSLAEDGCRAIGYWEPELSGWIDGRVRLASFQSALLEQGLTFDPAFVTGFTPASDGARSILTHQEQGYQAAMRVFGNPAAPKPDGLVIIDDMLTDGAIGGLEKLGICVGKDIKIASLTNLGSPILFNDREKLTQVEFDPKDIVQAMLRLLDDTMAGLTPSGQVVRIIPTLRRPEYF